MAGKGLKLMNIQVKSKIYAPLPKTSSGTDWSLWRADSSPQTLCLTPLIQDIFGFY